MTRERLLAILLRPTTPPLAWGIVTATALIALEIVAVSQLKRIAPDNAFGAVFLFGVLVVSAGWGFRLAFATSLASALAYVYFHVSEGEGSLAPAIVVFLTLAILTNLLVGQARLRAAESEQRRREADSAAELARTMLQAAAALRRVATLVARRVEPADLYPVVVDELCRGLNAEHATLFRYESAAHAVVLASLSPRADRRLPDGEQFPLDDGTVVGRIAATGQPARVTAYRGAGGPGAARLLHLGRRSGAGAPILVGDRVWGALIVGTTTDAPLPEDTEIRITDFADLVATAIYNAETRAELTASRARIVAAADQARRGFERDLHDGAQQRIVSLGLELRTIEAALPPEDRDIRPRIAGLVESLSNLHTDLQELSRGLHPAVLSRGGLGPAVKTLARRSPIPVDLTIDVAGRMPESVEVAGYYLIAEALTNAAKYARADEVTLRVTADESALHITVSDDGVGGADPRAGSGLIGLRDRVEALSGHFEVASRPDAGTTLSAVIPLNTPTTG